LIFIGIDYLQTGMAGVSWNLEAFTGQGSRRGGSSPESASS